MNMNEQINITGVEDALVEKTNSEIKEVLINKVLANKKIAISVSINEDLGKIGLSEQHINDISIEIARYIISNGGTALYGGDLRVGGFTRFFSELSNQYKIANDRSFRFINYFPFPNSKLIDRHIQADFVSKQIKAKILPYPDHLNIDEEKEYKPFENLEDRYIYCECFKDMREKMAKDSVARILVGGKINNYLGYMPGVIEEAFYTLLENKPVYLVGGFGGATEKIIKLIKGEEVNEFTNDYQYSTEFLNQYKDFISEKYDYYNYEDIKAKFLEYPMEKISELNKLTIEENEILFTSKNIHEIVYLIIKGLKNLQ